MALKSLKCSLKKEMSAINVSGKHYSIVLSLVFTSNLFQNLIFELHVMKEVRSLVKKNIPQGPTHCVMQYCLKSFTDN